jgi:hypothetical protein
MTDGHGDRAPGGHVTPGESNGKKMLDFGAAQLRGMEDDKQRQLYVRPLEQEHDPSSRPIGDVETVDKQGHEQRGLRRWWNKISAAGKTLTVVIPTFAGALAILATLGIVGGSSSPSQLPGYVVIKQSDLLVQKAPNLFAPSVGSVSYHTTVHIVCTKDGDAVTGPGNGGKTVTSRLWDYIQSSPSPPGFVPDVWVYTGTTNPKAPSCR